jgi:hypothetical protein
MVRGRKWWLVVALGLVGLGFGGFASTASATFHLIKVRELFPGTVAQPDSDYVELQAYSAFQNQVYAGRLQVYNPDGSLASSFMPPPPPLPRTDNQMTVLIADSGFGSVFPGVTSDFTDSTLNLSAGGGAVCWPITELPIDCVSWGAFTGNSSLPSSAGSPFQGTGASGAIGDGKAIIRSIGAGCPTFLEDGDDSNNSAADFSEATPNPRANSAAITEVACALSPPAQVVAAPHKKKRKCRKHKKASPGGTGGGGGAPAYAAKKKCKKKRK